MLKRIKNRILEIKEDLAMKKVMKERQRQLDREQRLKDYEDLLKYAGQKKSESFVEKERKRINEMYANFKKKEAKKK